MVTFCRSKFGNFKEYHTSLDNFELVKKNNIKESFDVIKNTIDFVMNSKIPVTTRLCEPFLQKYNLHENINLKRKGKKIKNLLNFIQFSDGKNDLDDISALIKINKTNIKKISLLLLRHKLIRYL